MIKIKTMNKIKKVIKIKIKKIKKEIKKKK